MKRINNRTLFWGNTKFTLGRPKIANFNSAKTFKITNSQTLISANISSFTVGLNMNIFHLLLASYKMQFQSDLSTRLLSVLVHT